MAVLEYADVDAAVKDLEANHKFIIRNEEQEKSFLDNHEKKFISEKTAEFYSSLDNNIRDVSGVDRLDEEKSYVYLKRAFGTQKTAFTDLEKVKVQLETDIKKLKEDGFSETEQVGELKKQLVSTKQLLKDGLAEKEVIIEGFKTAQFNSELQGAVDNAINRFRPFIKKDLPEEAVTNSIENIRRTFLTDSKPIKLEGGGFVFNDKDNKPLQNPKDGNMLSIYDILKPKFDFMLQEKKITSGAGSGDGGSGDPDPGDKYKLELPDTIKSRSDLIDFLRKEKKIDYHDQVEFTKYYNANVKPDMSYGNSRQTN